MSPQRRPQAGEDHHFEIHASIVFQLGEDLITDVVQALVELVKNSYDADGTYSKIVVSSNSENEYPDSYFPGAKGHVLIEDDGIGMDEETIRLGWLTISNSAKREMKKARIKTTRGRTPLGDKGLGRLGVQRLGNNVEIFTKPKGEDFEYHVGWSWSDFAGENTLSQVQVKFSKTPSRRRHGTRILISELKEPDYWEGSDAFIRFENNLSKMISPYGGFQEFSIVGSVNGRSLELAELSKKIRRLAQLRYRIEFDSSSGLCIRGRARLDFIRPEKESEEFEELVESDQGRRFFEFLKSRRGADAISLKPGKSGEWFAEYEERRKFESLAGLNLLNGKPASPGPFVSEIDMFNLGRGASGNQSVFNRGADYRDYVKRLSGVRIFRDGFGVRLDKDWMGFAAQWTSGGSWYGLKPENTLGFVAITAEHNSSLVETTDREGFKATPEFENFRKIFSEVLRFAEEAQEFLRRGWNEYKVQNQRTRAKVTPEESPREIQQRLNAELSKAASFREPLEKVRANLETASKRSSEALRSTKRSSIDAKQFERLKSANEFLEHQVKEAQSLLAGLSGFIPEAERLKELDKVLQDELQAIQDQLEQTYETVGLGLTAEALSHEINNISDQLAMRTQEMSKYLVKLKITDAKIFSYMEYVKSSVAALRKQLSHLAPSLRNVRERRQDINFNEFMDEIAEYHHQRWADTGIRINRRGSKEEFVLKINRGKLTQVFDNLILNSEYWIKESMRTGKQQKGEIYIDVKPPFILVSDNGPGIDPSIEQTLFDPFITRKPRGRGRGLGLYIVRQLLDTEECTIELTQKRNGPGHLFQFRIDFTGASDERD
ncbi:MAG TPA: ATP-binding protein [Holophagaceae bacterium]|nr:ATP-binding protein [Holophagaceae bacterium]